MIQRLMRRVHRDEQGIALVTVIAIGSVLTMLVVAGIAFTLGGFQKSRSDQDWNAALAAAYAGVEEYQSRLSADPAYVRYGNAASEYTSYIDPLNPSDTSMVSVVSAPPTANDAFGLGTTGTWATVSGSAAAFFRYEVNNSKFDAEGKLTLRVTGKVGDQTRSVLADLKQNGFVEYVYFTEYETLDPNSFPALRGSNCDTYKWANPGRTSSCDIIFDNGDTLDGPVHSNDSIRICNATFEDPVTSENNTAPYYIRPSGCSPNFLGGVPKHAEHIEMPPTNQEMKTETRYDLQASTVPNPGCLYTGPTSIKFHDNGTMTVKSPWTKYTQVSGEPATAGRNLQVGGEYYCGNPSSLDDAGGTIVKVPNNNLIFVQDVPGASGTPDPNYSASAPTGVACNGFYSGPSWNRVWNPPNNGLGYPVANETVPQDGYPLTDVYGCREGDVFIEGTLDGRVTVAAENSVYVVNDLKYEEDEGDDSDMLGLVGGNAIYVWNPWRSGSGCLSSYCDSSSNGRTIQAAILSVEHTFTVQNYPRIGNRGTLHVLGSIAQKHRGPVAQGGNGYVKDYRHDTRFKYTAPPKFLTPASTTYGISTWIEINPVFAADGTYK